MSCKHYWRIGEANGPTSVGVCDYCHEVKTFQNYSDLWLILTQEEHRALRMYAGSMAGW